MLILAVDTSGKQGSVALARGDAANFELIENVPVAGGTFSAQLIPAIASLLSRHSIAKEKLEGIAAASGPGSFTGLRVGLAAVKGLGETLRIPIASVSILEACAHAQKGRARQSRILVALDASRGDLFLGKFQLTENGLQSQGESLVNMEEFLQSIREENQQQMLCSPHESVIHSLEQQGISIAKIDRPGSAEIALLGLRKIAAGEVVSPEALDANYIRRAEFTKAGVK
ncbi:MAG TPA: tRNA (adenosine(37)-N6)-threonylcarbamoyltransferase complex dimerization subunit type 1 TsaB [Candidatus Angelobacter sp.]|nr:tRNA (adenosine(37)-N6)-threonylcarbamoyltransferase complex dimerization subunit type 1 TsaB [Candidatus Angelobacter sp.]